MSKKLKLSPKFSVKRDGYPKRIGVYKAEGSHSKELCWSFFDGSTFNGRWLTKESALFNRLFGEGCDVLKWQGVLK